MHPVLQELHQDHLNFARLLEVLANELEVSEGGGDPDYQLVQDILVYMENYADVVHHTREDTIYELLRERHPKASATVQELLLEHEALRSATLDARNLVSRVLSEAIVDREDVEQRLAVLLRRQREHMGREEAAVFPMLERTFGARDWDDVRERLPAVSDPLFGTNVAQDYRTLYERITG